MKMEQDIQDIQDRREKSNCQISQFPNFLKTPEAV